jgi:methylated-DNA-[protein]-cysteine S-methyltransferase
MSWKNKAREQGITGFQLKVYSLVSKIPRAKVTTYGAIAKRLGASPRAVGQALKKNPFAPEVPCHMVVRSDGSIGGFGGKTNGRMIEKKIRLLRDENVIVSNKHISKGIIIDLR